MERITVFDTTLRDGEQSPGATMSRAEKVRVARELEGLGVDVIEAGFPASTLQEFQAVQAVAEAVQTCAVAALARATEEDIDRAAAAVTRAERPRIHTFIATSDLHLERKLRITRDACLRRVQQAVRRARTHVADVQFSAEDATRSDPSFLLRVVEVALEAGATTINVPDTVGHAHPAEFGELVGEVRRICPDDVTVSAHCHNDLGLAVANTLAAVEQGARQVEVTVNGIGERAGNAALEEVVMALEVLPRYRDRFRTQVVTRRIYRTSELVSRVTGIRPQPNKAIVGRNAFAHEAGIHQDGVLKDPATYEIMAPDVVGVPERRLVLGKHSGRHAVADRYRALGFDLTEEELARAYHALMELTERKKELHDEDLLAVYYGGTLLDVPKVFRLERLEVRCGTPPARADVTVRMAGERPVSAMGSGDGPIDAAFAALSELVPWHARLERFSLEAAGGGRDAVGEAQLLLRVEGHVFRGRGASTDVVEAAVLAYLNALDKAAHARTLEERALASVQLWGV